MVNGQEFMDPEEREWVEMRNRAKAKQEATHNGNPQLTMAQHDEMRKLKAIEQQAALRAAAVTPESLVRGAGSPLEVDFNVSLPKDDPDRKTQPALVNKPGINIASTVPPLVTSSTANVTQDICVWECRVNDLTIYAANWGALKEKIKTCPGTWEAKECTFNNNINDILGFFAPDQHPGFKCKSVKVFDIIVQNGKVFKGES